ncbi:uncharacterized protein BBOV_IV005215 [Babesia bovis T2Bo]|uniref:uncharacterized protein n=1 Tax=Babesia bovis T2Bo TaxID=484906 RepID=UPI001E0EC5CB|nr:uncharacterized protein BBOV_IV005215 [Babesia bovis T2Bo]KAG6439968.1 hypothetical protein BBOV_IV005215 [Babesia bovis T2Bo]
MAGRSEKKRLTREKNFGFYYCVVAVLCMTLWVVCHLFNKDKCAKLGNKRLILRTSLIAVPYGLSLLSIFSSLKLGLPFSTANDLFCLTTLICILSIFVDWAYKLLFVIPLFFVFKFGKWIYQWALTPGPEPAQNPPKTEKVKRKYKTIRV